MSVNTVKSHLKRIHAKLGVSSRAETVERARLLGLLRLSFRETAHTLLGCSEFTPQRFSVWIKTLLQTPAAEL